MSMVDALTFLEETQDKKIFVSSSFFNKNKMSLRSQKITTKHPLL